MLISKFDTNNIENKIMQFEKEYGISLPSQYKNFLMKYNGGYTPMTKFSIEDDSSSMEGFYGIGEVDMSLDKSYKSKYIPEWIEQGLLPITMDYFGNNIVIGVGKENEGIIYFADHEEGNRLIFLAEDLKSFFASCHSEVLDKNAIKSVEEREVNMIAKGLGDSITDGLRKVWQEEIDFQMKINQEEVILDD